MMPKLGPSLAAMSPALVKFGIKFVDKGVGLKRPWVRLQEYSPVLTGAIGFGMMYTDTYPEAAQGIWHGSVAMFADGILGQFHKLIDPQANNPNSSQLQTQLSRANALLTEGQRQLLTQGQGALPAGQGAGVRTSVMEF